MNKIYIIAGEASGDFLGAKILEHLQNVDISIVGGQLMEATGHKSLFDISAISVGGIFEVIPKILTIKKLISKTIQDIKIKNPDIVLTIDSPGFNFRIAKALKRHNKNLKLVHLVAPSVWAWRPNRAKKLSKIYNLMLTLFDFEPQFFEKYGLKSVFVGHPAAENFNISLEPKENTILLLPGSRIQEIEKLLPIFLQATALRQEKIVIPTLKHLESLIRKISSGYNVDVISSESEKQILMQNAKFAIAASGTATLQLALSGCPMIVCYKLSKLTFSILKCFVKTKHISLVNIILNSTIVPELIQSNCTIENIKKQIESTNFENQKHHFKKLKQHLLTQNISPAAKIANILLGKIT